MERYHCFANGSYVRELSNKIEAEKWCDNNDGIERIVIMFTMGKKENVEKIRSLSKIDKINTTKQEGSRWPPRP